MNILILIKLIAAHVIGDFFLQTDKICEGKYARGTKRLGYLAIHSGINALLAYVLVGLWDCWQIPVIVFVTHYLIDYIKSAIGSGSLWMFITDQTAHFTVIIGLWTWLTDASLYFDGSCLSDYRIWVIALCYMSALKPASILIGTFIAKWTPDNHEKNSLPNAGAWIGYFETYKGKGCKNHRVRNDRYTVKFYHCHTIGHHRYEINGIIS